MPQPQSLPCTTTVNFVLEERKVDDLQNTNFAWTFSTEAEAVEMMHAQVRVFGPDRFYTMFLQVD